jgi:predicted AAA+ superfamily ATPase
MNDLPRLLTPSVRDALDSFPVVIVTGARQTGKSTLSLGLSEESEQRTFLNLDNLEALERARSEPDSLARSADRLTIDEVQRSPDLLLAIKRVVDEGRSPGRFLLTGSANLLLMKNIGETLAGRAVYWSLWPFSRREQLGLGRAGRWSELWATPDSEWLDLLRAENPLEEDWRALALRGGYPVPAHSLRTPAERALWFAGYAQTYLERDVQDFATISSITDFRRLMRAICLRVGQLANQTEIGRDVGLSQPTVHRHLGLLEISYQLVRVPAYSVNRTRRLIKTPKLFWCDTGLAMHLSGETEPRGAHLENLVLADLLAWKAPIAEAIEVLYWRTTEGEEVDFVIERGGELLPIEVKASAQPRFSDARGLQLFRTEYADRTRAGLLLHTGEEIRWIADGVLAVPWWRVF